MSQSQVARLTGKTQAQVARLELGLGDPGISSLVQIARSLGMEIVAVPIRLLPAIQQLLAAHDPASTAPLSTKLVGNDPEDQQEDNDGS